MTKTLKKCNESTLHWLNYEHKVSVDKFLGNECTVECKVESMKL